MSTIFLKNKPLMNNKSLYFVKINDNGTIEVSDDNIYVKNKDEDYNSVQEINDFLNKKSLKYVEASEEEFINAYKNIASKIVNLVKR